MEKRKTHHRLNNHLLEIHLSFAFKAKKKKKKGSFTPVLSMKETQLHLLNKTYINSVISTGKKYFQGQQDGSAGKSTHYQTG